MMADSDIHTTESEEVRGLIRAGRAAVRVGDYEAAQVEYCYRHPDTETALHCTSCGRPICVRCSTPAAVGQLCPECRRGRRAPNYQVAPSNVLLGGLVGLAVSALAAVFVTF